jgi:putative Ca2+/H+ antiporter (TMEM165/GDT1 family)
VLAALFIAFGVVFVAEFGDKSQLLTLTLATKYRALPVLIAITVATMVLQALSVGVGGALGASLPTTFINSLAAAAFLGFAIWTLVDSDDDDDHVETSPTFTPRRVIVSVASMFFLAELGDKTMLSSMTLATDRNLFGTWLGATLGMVAADGLALLLGKYLGDRIPRRAIRYGSAAVFFVFATLMLIDALR